MCPKSKNAGKKHFLCGSPLLGGPNHYTKQCEQYIFITSWSLKCILCKHYTTFELSLIYSTLYMAFPRQPLLFTETVPHNAYETVEKLWRGNIRSNKIFFFRIIFAVKIFPKKFRTQSWYIACGNRFDNNKFRRRQILYADTLIFSTQDFTVRKIK